MKILLKTAIVDNKHISYTSKTEFYIQVGKHKSAYKTKYRIVGNLPQAITYFNSINVGNGYKKRLLVPSFKKRLLVRQFS